MADGPSYLRLTEPVPHCSDGEAAYVTENGKKETVTLLIVQTSVIDFIYYFNLSCMCALIMMHTSLCYRRHFKTHSPYLQAFQRFIVPFYDIWKVVFLRGF